MHHRKDQSGKMDRRSPNSTVSPQADHRPAVAFTPRMVFIERVLIPSVHSWDDDRRDIALIYSFRRYASKESSNLYMV